MRSFLCIDYMSYILLSIYYILGTVFNILLV